MRILILGNNGYIGVALHRYLEERGHEVYGCDNGMREDLVSRVGGKSITPVNYPESEDLDITNYYQLKKFVEKINPDVIVHLAEQPSAPYSMRNAQCATMTQQNNIVGTLNVLWAIREVNPKIHLVKLGTAGEYPDWLYPNMKIPESSRIEVQYQGKDWTIPTPRYAGSWYHFSKLHDSYNCDYASRIWGLKITDINQSPVWGYMDGTRIDVDEYFGTVVNRFAAQAVVGSPLTIYGKGEQTRGFIYIEDSLEAIRLIIENADFEGYRIINQMTEVMTINELAMKFKRLTGCKIEHIENPRAEMESHSFDYTRDKLKEFGLKPKRMNEKLDEFIGVIEKYKENIPKDFLPKTKWK